MGRQRDPNRDKAKEIYIASKGEINLIDIAAQLGVSDGTVRGWNAKDKWENLIFEQPKVTIKEKMHALKQVAMRIGMIGPLREICDSLGDKVEINKPLVFLTICQYLRDDISIWQKYACAMILDYYIPKWREIVPEVLGPIIDRDSKEVRKWRKRVLERDGFKCVECGNKENLEAHHILPWSTFPDLRTDINNGKTLCNECHAGEHEHDGVEHLILSRSNKTNNTNHNLSVGCCG